MIIELTNHLWQSTLFAAGVAVLVWALRRNRAEVRHGLWVAASAKFLVPFATLIALGSALAPAPAPSNSSTGASMTIAAAVDQIAEPFDNVFVTMTPAASASKTRIDWLPWTLFAVWAAGFIALVLVRVRGWRNIVAALRASRPFDGGSAAGAIEIRVAPGVFEPGVVGWFQPVLLLPAGIETHLTRAQLDAVIAHEVCHVRRRDNLTAAGQMIVECLFWFYPLVWWIGARLVDERERACDEHVVGTLGESKTYAEGILGICKRYVESPVACVSGVTGSNLKRRITDIIHERVGSQLTRGRRVMLVAAAIAAIVLPFFAGMAMAPLRAASSQTGGQEQKFEVASVKPCEPQPVPSGGRSGGGNGSFSPGRAMLSCFVVRNLINIAHVTNRSSKGADDPLDAWPFRAALIGTGPQQVRGGPDWVYSDKYSIEAKAEHLDPSDGRAPDRAVMLGPMLRALLEDRFKLKVHVETEETPMWALTVARGGLKVKPWGPEGGCTTLDPAKGRGPSMDEEIAMVRRGEKPICGHGIIGGKNGGNEALALGGQPMSGVARALSMFSDRMIVDRTGIDGRFNLYLEFKADEFAGDSLFFLQRNSTTPPLPPTAPSLPIAMREQWGLVLEPVKGPRGYIVIDQIERPTPDSPLSAVVK